MKTTLRTVLKVLSAVTAAALIGAILFITNSFIGNPISKAMANRAIMQYVNEKYPSMDLVVGKAAYNFKDGAYAARAKSKVSIDTHFFIYYRSGKVQRDDYESYVTSMFNTLDRLSDEYSAIAKSIVAEELGYENNTTMVMYNKDEYGKANDILKLDMEFDKALPVKSEVMLRLDLKDSSLKNIAKVITDAHEAFIKNGCKFNTYSLYAENDGMLVMINGVTPADIEDGNLANLLEKAGDNSSTDGISVFIKGEKN